MGSNFHEYDPKQVLLILNGVHIHGFLEGTFITARRNKDAMSLQVGVDGEGTRSKSSDKSGRLEIFLNQSSESNDVFSALALADEATGLGVVPAMLKDNSGRSLFVAENAWVVKFPDAPFETNSVGRQWILETDNLTVFLGGS